MISLGDARGGIGHTRSRRHQTDARTAAGAGIAIGHVGRTLLVLRRDEADALRSCQRIHQIQDRCPDDAKDDLHPLSLQAVHHHFGTGSLQKRMPSFLIVQAIYQ